MARSTDFCFKTIYVSMFFCFRLIVALSPFGKEVSHEPPPPWKLLPLNPPSPLEFPMIFHGGLGGGMDIFWNHTIEMDDGSG